MQIIETLKQTGAFIRKVYQEIPDTYSSTKGKRMLDVSRIKVTITIDGQEIAFDGDERSQDRLNRAYTVAKGKNKLAKWKTYDNADVMLTADQILDILDAAGMEQTSLWF